MQHDSSRWGIAIAVMLIASSLVIVIRAYRVESHASYAVQRSTFDR